ncbi:MAG: NUDIX domain-containing protein [Bdellovibrionales bacterium]|nr:NUDIX domain-containing protein [Bdellovibrionales bacterium]
MLLRLAYRILGLYWRIRRPIVLGVCAVVIRDNKEVLLVRHSYIPGWHFPGGGIKRGESASQAAARELWEETGLRALTEPTLCAGPTYRILDGKHDHVMFFSIDEWERDPQWKKSFEILESRFFPTDELPAGTSERVREVLSRNV